MMMDDEERVNEILRVLFHPTVNRSHEFFSCYSLSPADCTHIMETLEMFERQIGYVFNNIKSNLKNNRGNIEKPKHTPEKTLPKVDRLQKELDKTLVWFQELTSFVDAKKKKKGCYTSVKISSYNSHVARLMIIFYDIQTLDTKVWFNL
ncbi:MAG: hypothetical protein LBE98_03520 [Puniceicoccales bacterium]|jgi:hypothetical protein|nr:hypothetical protein [Puniceicoccales bacterium]